MFTGLPFVAITKRGAFILTTGGTEREIELQIKLFKQTKKFYFIK